MTTPHKLLWSPDTDRINKAQVEKFRLFVENRHGLSFSNYAELWHWSVTELETFWEDLWHYFEMDRYSAYQYVLDSHDMPGCRWFEGAELNYAEQILKRGRAGHIAIKSVSEVRGKTQMGWDELDRQVKILAQHLRKLGIKPGDRIAAFMPAIAETTVAMLATTAVGAVWFTGPWYKSRTGTLRADSTESFICC